MSNKFLNSYISQFLFKQFKKKMISLMLLGLIVSSINIVLPYLLKKIVDIVTLGQNLPFFMMASYPILVVVGKITENLREFMFGRLDANLEKVFSLLVSHQIILMEKISTEKHTGGLHHVIKHGTQAIKDYFYNGLFVIVPLIFEVICINSIILLIFPVTISMLLLFFLMCYIASSFLITEWASKARAHYMNKSIDVYDRLNDYIMSRELIKILNAEQAILDKIKQVLERFREKLVSFTDKMALAGFLQSCVLLMLCGLIFLNMHQSFDNGQLTLGDFVLFVSYLVYLLKPLQSFGLTYALVRKSSIDLEVIQDFLYINGKNKNDDLSYQSIAIRKNAYPIVCRRLSFFIGDNSIVENVNFSIESGEKVALIGPSGSGKTTLAKIFCGLKTPTNGNYFLYGHDTAYLASSTIREHVVYVPQDAPVFNESLSFNLRMAHANTNYEQMMEILESLHIKYLFDRECRDRNFRIGESGSKISKGERQRIGIARALLKDADVYVFDESTSALDKDNQRSVMDFINEYLEEKTIVFITHQLSLVKSYRSCYHIHDHHLAKL